MDYVKGNLLTILVSALAVVVVLTVITNLPLLFAFLVWLGSFLLDACHTYLNRQYVKQYELNMVVRRSKDIELAFLKVAIIESAMIVGIGMVFEVMAMGSSIGNGNGSGGNSSDSSSNPMGYVLSFVLFASIHVMAFVRSYLFIRRKKKEKERKE